MEDIKIGSIDLLFVDADKVSYPEYFEKGVKLLKSGGIGVFDNMLWGGTVLNPKDIESKADTPRPAEGSTLIILTVETFVVTTPAAPVVGIWARSAVPVLIPIILLVLLKTPSLSQVTIWPLLYIGESTGSWPVDPTGLITVNELEPEVMVPIKLVTNVSPISNWYGST